MGWERRGRRGTLYYYRVRRTPDGVIAKEYCGRGRRAGAAADDVAHSQAKRAADWRTVQEELARLSNLDAQGAELGDLAQLLMEATLLAKGFHRPNYGSWRKRRGEQEEHRATARAGGAG